MGTNQHQDCKDTELLFKQGVFAIVGAAMEVELLVRQILFESHKAILVNYKA